MMKSQIPTLVAIFIILVSLGASLFIINNTQTLKLGARGKDNPEDLRITNIENNSFTVSWLTSGDTIGFVKYTDMEGNTKETIPTTIGLTHFAVISDLNPDNFYTFVINSAGTIYDNNGSPWQLQTTNTTSLDDSVISGEVLNESGLPAKNALVYITAQNISKSAVVKPSGNWVVSFPNLAGDTVLDILIESSESVIAGAKIELKDANPTPVITLNKSYDFRNNVTPKQMDNPVVNILLP